MAYGDFFELRDGNIVINSPEILLVREFSDLWEQSRNVCKNDKTGEKRLKARRELTFIWLMYNYRSPYKDYVSQDRYNESVLDSRLTESELKDPLLSLACRKYKELIVTRMHKLLNQADETCDNLVLFLRNIDFDERKADGSLVHNHKNIMDSLAKATPLIKSLIETRKAIEKESQDMDRRVRGDAETGLFD